MLIRNKTEYALGDWSRKELRKLNGRREDYSFIGGLLRTFVGGAPGLIGLLLGVFYGSGVLVAVGGSAMLLGGLIALTTWCNLPVTRRLFAGNARDKGRLITEDDLLFQLVVNEWVETPLQRLKEPGKMVVKEAIDEFIEFAGPYRNRYNPEQSEFLTPEWERDNGKLYEHPKLLAIDIALDESYHGFYGGSTTQHARKIVRPLQQKRLALMQAKLVGLGKQGDQTRNEIAHLQSALLTSHE